MCNPAFLAPLLGGAGATAAGATAAAGTAAAAGAGIAGTLQTIGTIVSIGGAIAQGIGGLNAANEQAAAIADQRKTEAQLTITEDMRSRQKFMAQIEQQRAELAARGVQLDSVTAVSLGQTAAKEMSFGSQAIRAGGAARDRELSAAQKAAKAQGASSMLKGVFSAAGGLLTAAPDLWPGFEKKQFV